MERKLVQVVVPLYREELPPLEEAILRHNMSVLSSYDFVFLLPEGLSVDRLEDQISISQHQIIRVSDQWLGTKRGIMGYNEMMLSGEFYRLFEYATQYILICQTDAYIFRDELREWCERGYDYVGAPWVARKKYSRPFIKQYYQLRQRLFFSKLDPTRFALLGRIGNGGLSLRRVDSAIAACERYRAEIDYFNSKTTHLYNEDSFWAFIPKEFNYPTTAEGFRFSIDIMPVQSFAAAEGVIPMGCHGLTDPCNNAFWSDKIEILRMFPLGGGV